MTRNDSLITMIIEGNARTGRSRAQLMKQILNDI